MSKFRVNKTGNFTVMSNYHFKERRMSLKAKGLLSLMLSLPDEWNYSVSGLVTLSKDGKDSVMSALAELEKFGYLKRERVVNSKGQFDGIEYNIYEEPQPENPITEKPISANKDAEKPTAEKREQLNTNQLSTNIINNLNVSNTKNREDSESFKKLLDDISNEELKDLYSDYIEMRKGIDAPLTTRGLKMLIDRCERLSKNNIKVQKLLLETAIINNWKNVYLPNEAEVAAANNETIEDFKSYLGLD